MTIAAPQTVAEATRMLKKYAGAQGKIAAIEAERTSAIAVANVAADKKLLPLVGRIREMNAALEPWWAENAETLTKGERKSIELGGCEIGTALGAPTLVFAGDHKDFGAKALKGLRWAKTLVRTVVSTDKVAVRKALDGERGPELKKIGFSTKQPESFFVRAIEMPSAKA